MHFIKNPIPCRQTYATQISTTCRAVSMLVRYILPNSKTCYNTQFHITSNKTKILLRISLSPKSHLISVFRTHLVLQSTIPPSPDDRRFSTVIFNHNLQMHRQAPNSRRLNSLNPTHPLTEINQSINITNY